MRRRRRCCARSRSPARCAPPELGRARRRGRAGRGWHTGAMPELPDVSVYLERLTAKVVGHRLERVRIGHPFLLSPVTPALCAVQVTQHCCDERLGKRIVLALERELVVVVRVMITGRLG